MKKGKKIFIEFSKISEKTQHGYAVYSYFIRKIEDKEIIGSCCLRVGDNLSDLGNVGYEVDEDYRGLGYGEEALALLCAEAAVLGFFEITAVCKIDNTASRKICEKNGGIEISKNDGKKTVTYKIKV